MFLFSDILLTETEICYLTSDFDESILICKRKFVKNYSKKICTMIINSSGSVAKVNLFRDIRLCSMS